jgi:predicted enzyme related to lactoylglutathione lyase
MPFPYTTVFVALADVGDGLLVRFYQHLLQQDPIVHVPNVYAEFQLAGLRLGIFQPKASHQAEFDHGSSGSMSLCFEVTDLESAIDRLAAIGYPVTREITVASHGREVYAYDPAGNRLILHEAIAG